MRNVVAAAAAAVAVLPLVTVVWEGKPGKPPSNRLAVREFTHAVEEGSVWMPS